MRRKPRAPTAGYTPPGPSKTGVNSHVGVRQPWLAPATQGGGSHSRCAKVQIAVKPCPYCAELIQDAAAKCRFCGEWLDPSRRPAWSLDRSGPAGSATVVPVAAEPAAQEREPTPAPTIVPAPTEPPVADASPHLAPARSGAGAPSWETPSAWLAQSQSGEHPRVAPAAQTFVEAPVPGTGQPAPVSRETLQETSDAQSSLEEVAQRMQRIKASAAAVRHAVEQQRGATGHEPPHPGDSSARTRIDGPLPEASPPPASLSYPGAEQPVEPLRRDGTIPGLAPAPAVVSRAAAPAYDPPPEPAAPAFTEPPAPAPVVDERSMRSQVGEFDDDDDDDDDDFGDDGFGGFDDDDDDDDDDFAGDASGFGDIAGPASRPVPWRPILAGAAVVILVGGFLMRDRLFGSSEQPAAADAETKIEDKSGDVRSGSVAPTAAGAAQVANAASNTAGEGKPVVAEDEAPEVPVDEDPNAAAADTAEVAEADTAAADPAATAGSPPPAAMPPEALAKLDEARETYKKANGRKRPLEQAKGQLEEVLTVSPDHPDALLILAQVQLELGDMDASLASAERCVELAAEQADCWLTIGTIKQEKKDNEVAAKAYERYLALAPDGRYAGTIRKLLKNLK